MIILCLTGSLLSQNVYADEERKFRHINNWTKQEKLLFGSYALLSHIDYGQTSHALNHPCNCYTEGNPFLGKKPSDEQLLLINLGISALLYHGVGSGRPNESNKALSVITAARLAVVVYNDTNIGVSWKVAF